MFTGVAFLISLKISLDFSLVHDLRVMRSSSTLKILSLSLCPPLKKKICAFLTSSQMMLMLLVQEAHLRELILKEKYA